LREGRVLWSAPPRVPEVTIMDARRYHAMRVSKREASPRRRRY